jgi:hypothetical protein
MNSSKGVSASVCVSALYISVNMRVCKEGTSMVLQGVERPSESYVQQQMAVQQTNKQNTYTFCHLVTLVCISSCYLLLAMLFELFVHTLCILTCTT